MVLVQLFLQEPAPDGMARPPRSPAGLALAADAIQAAYNLQRLLVKLDVCLLEPSGLPPPHSTLVVAESAMILGVNL
jgi:hypothetical protein